MTRFHRGILITAVLLLSGCGVQQATSTHASKMPSVRVTGKSPTQWSMEYSSAKMHTLSLWFGHRDNALYLFVPEDSTGSATLDSTEQGLVFRVGGSKVRPLGIKDFAFHDGPTATDPDGSVIIGTCSEGQVGIRITKEPN